MSHCNRTKYSIFYFNKLWNNKVAHKLNYNILKFYFLFISELLETPLMLLFFVREFLFYNFIHRNIFLHTFLLALNKFYKFHYFSNFLLQELFKTDSFPKEFIISIIRCAASIGLFDILLKILIFISPSSYTGLITLGFCFTSLIFFLFIDEVPIFLFTKGIFELIGLICICWRGSKFERCSVFCISSSCCENS